MMAVPTIEFSPPEMEEPKSEASPPRDTPNEGETSQRGAPPEPESDSDPGFIPRKVTLRLPPQPSVEPPMPWISPFTESALVPAQSEVRTTLASDSTPDIAARRSTRVRRPTRIVEEVAQQPPPKRQRRSTAKPAPKKQPPEEAPKKRGPQRPPMGLFSCPVSRPAPEPKIQEAPATEFSPPGKGPLGIDKWVGETLALFESMEIDAAMGLMSLERRRVAEKEERPMCLQWETLNPAWWRPQETPQES